MNRYEMKYLPTVMGQMGLDVEQNIKEVNNALLDGRPITIHPFGSEDVQFKPDWDNTFIATRISGKLKQTWDIINLSVVCWALRVYGVGNDIGRLEAASIVSNLELGETAIYRGLKFKPDSKGGFRVYTTRRLTHPFGKIV